MPRFLIEVPHEAETVACAKVVQIFLADWGCKDGDHRAWIIVDVGSREEARSIVPPAFRAQAKIVGLNTFTMEQIDDILRHHQS
jgi:hypothetical protein